MSPRQQKLIITCRHDNPGRIIRTYDGELVCACGVVLEERMPDESESVTHSKVSLYHQVEAGGNPGDTRAVSTRIHVHASSASQFSNICSKLGLSPAVQTRAWHLYHMLRSKTYRTRAKCAVFAVYTACREAGQAVDEPAIRSAVQSVLCTKSVPHTLEAIYDLHYDMADMGVDSNDGHSSEYYLNLAVSSHQHLFCDPEGYDRFKLKVTENFGRMTGNPRHIAARAVLVAMSDIFGGK